MAKIILMDPVPGTAYPGKMVAVRFKAYNDNETETRYIELFYELSTTGTRKLIDVVEVMPLDETGVMTVQAEMPAGEEPLIITLTATISFHHEEDDVAQITINQAIEEPPPAVPVLPVLPVLGAIAGAGLLYFLLKK